MPFKRKIKYKYIKRSKGVISIFLCLILTPCMSLASALIEYSRYQGTMQTTREIVNVSDMATMSNYDEYLLDRFGLLAVSQEENISKNFNKYFDKNVDLLGKAINIENKDVKGTVPLSDNEVMKQQLLDFGETTVLTDSLLEDFGLEDLLKKIDKSNTISQLSDKASKTVELIDSVEDLVKSIKKLKESVTTVSDKADKVLSDFGKLNSSLISCREAIEEDLENVKENINSDTGEVTYTYFFKDDTTEYSEAEAAKYVILNYLDYYKNIMNKAEELKNSLSDIANIGNDISNNIDNVKNKYSVAKEKLENLKKSSLKEEGEEEAENALDATNSVYEVIVNTVDGAIKEAAEVLKEDAINESKNVASTCISEITNKYHLNINMNDVTKENMSDTIKNTLSDMAIRILTQKDMQEGIPSTLKGLAIKSKEIAKSVEEVMKKTGNQFVDNMKNSVIGAVTKLLDAIKSLFELNVFYNPELNANVRADLLTEGQTSSYQLLLTGIGEFFSATQEFTSGISGLDFLQALAAVKKVFISIKTVFKSICEFVNETISNINRLFGYVTGDIKALYNDFLINAYMIHNLPNRTNYSTGKALTGMDYSKILYEEKNRNLLPIGGILSASEILKGEKEVTGYSEMFCGSELEYILAATNSEVSNQTIAFLNIYLLRMIVDVIPIMTDTSVSAMAASASIAAWVVYVLVILGEPLVDTILVANGGEVPIIKKTCYLSPTGITKLSSDLIGVAISNEELKKVANNKIKNGIAKELNEKYSDYSTEFQDGILKADYSKHMLLVLMFNSSPNATLDRFENIVQLETRKYYKEKGNVTDFEIKKSYTAISSDIEVKFNPFIDVFNFNNNSIFKKHLKIQRGY